MIIIQSIFVNIFGDNVILATLIASMTPIIEIKGAIPFGASQIWTTPLTPLMSLIICILGGAIASGITLIVLKKIMPCIQKHPLYAQITRKVAKKTQTLSTQSNEMRKYLLLCFFTLLPIPLTGYYTSCLISSVCNLRYLKSWYFINLGNAISGLIIITLGLLSKDILTIIFYIFLITFIVYAICIAFILTKHLIKRAK